MNNNTNFALSNNKICDKDTKNKAKNKIMQRIMASIKDIQSVAKQIIGLYTSEASVNGIESGIYTIEIDDMFDECECKGTIEYSANTCGDGYEEEVYTDYAVTKVSIDSAVVRDGDGAIIEDWTDELNKYLAA